MPYVEEAELVTNLMAQEGLARSKDFKSMANG